MFHLFKKTFAVALFYCLKRDYIKKCASECIYRLEKGFSLIWVAFLSVSVSFFHFVLYIIVNIRNTSSDILLGRVLEALTLLPLHISERAGDAESLTRQLFPKCSIILFKSAIKKKLLKTARAGISSSFCIAQFNFSFLLFIYFPVCYSVTTESFLLINIHISYIYTYVYI